MITQYIPSVFEGIVAKVSSAMEAGITNKFPVYFDFGHYSEVDKNLKQKDGSLTAKGKKFPLIWMVMDFEESMGTNPADYAVINSARFIIAHTTSPNYNMKDRRDKIYLPILYPIYAEFVKQMHQSVELGMPSELLLKHTKVDRPYWGEIPSGNMFSNHLDAIEIKNLNLKIKQKNCR